MARKAPFLPLLGLLAAVFFPSVGRAELITVDPGGYYLGEFDFAPSVGPLTDIYVTFSAAASTDISWELYDASGTFIGSGTLGSLGSDLQGYSTASDTISSSTGAGFIVLASADTFATDTPYVTATLPDGTIETVLDGGGTHNNNYNNNNGHHDSGNNNNNNNNHSDLCNNSYFSIMTFCSPTYTPPYKHTDPDPTPPDCSPVPLPASMPLLGTAMALVGLLSWSRKRSRSAALLSSRA